MIQANELRIGNYVNISSENTCCKIKSVFINGIHSDFGTHSNLGIEPIPLTEEWLIKFGFEWWDYGEYYYMDSICVHKDGTTGTYDSEYKVSEITIIIKHVHQLQNLYFCLVGEELKIK